MRFLVFKDGYYKNIYSVTFEVKYSMYTMTVELSVIYESFLLCFKKRLRYKTPVQKYTMDHEPFLSYVRRRQGERSGERYKLDTLKISQWITNEGSYDKERKMFKPSSTTQPELGLLFHMINDNIFKSFDTTIKEDPDLVLVENVAIVRGELSTDNTSIKVTKYFMPYGNTTIMYEDTINGFCRFDKTFHHMEQDTQIYVSKEDLNHMIVIATQKEVKQSINNSVESLL